MEIEKLLVEYNDLFRMSSHPYLKINNQSVINCLLLDASLQG